MSADITHQLARQALTEYLDESHKSLDWCAGRIGTITEYLRRWLVDDRCVVLTPAVVQFIADYPPEARDVNGYPVRKPSTTRWCPKCGITKHVDDFGHRNIETGAREPYCFACRRAADRERYSSSRTGATQ